MEEQPSLQKEGFISVLIQIMNTPQFGPLAEQRMSKLWALHRKMGLSSTQILKVKDIIVEVLHDELSDQLTPQELEAWNISIDRFGRQLAEGL